MKQHIPNVITLLNLFSGCIAIVFVMKNQLDIAAVFVLIGIVFDFFDGLVARALNVKSELGIQLDSLADMVTCGVVPGFTMYQFLQLTVTGSFIPYLGFLVTLAAAYRLARFNIDEDQQQSFKGLPTPANALFIMSLPLILSYQGNEHINQMIMNKWFLLSLIVLGSILMNANIKLFTLKFKKWDFGGNEVRYIFLFISIVLLITVKFAAIPPIIIIYILMSVLMNRLSSEKM
ncbi:CDP-diacylglycerol--serine O-phosphatidyltransferase [Leptobacterium sp. I13]|uniref:CDP-diacylglycerol--serine O-phosphatidyltransferase n=1 Tax=Leptobacterium meishanense TaxID=3128904 RepID=UPI0030EB68C1